jgi:hypothetical protein
LATPLDNFKPIATLSTESHNNSCVLAFTRAARANAVGANP